MVSEVRLSLACALKQRVEPPLTPFNRAEFPLQWLGECLIHQSILYEGNPDRTNIREKFVYNFDDPKPQEQAKADSSTAPATSAQPAIEVPTPQQPEVSMNEANDGGTAERPLLETHEYVLPQMADTVGGPTVNGTKDEVEQAPERAGVDTEMGGTN